MMIETIAKFAGRMNELSNRLAKFLIELLALNSNQFQILLANFYMKSTINLGYYILNMFIIF
jgi:hypothetical protein